MCPTCGGAIPRGRAGGLCPRCLLRDVLDDEPTVADVAADLPAAEFVARRFGNYELIEEIARGGMGLVFRARQVGLNRQVAVKVLAAGPVAGREFMGRFRTEAEAAAKLSHPNIVAIHEVGEVEGRPYFSMDLIEGPNLSEWRKAYAPSFGETAALVKALSEATHFAHQRGVLHRDLKPQNILMDAEDRPRITDFGLAKQVDDSSEITVTGMGFGTPGYAAPEQASGRHDQVGPASDVYSLGAILYFLLTGQAPHAGPSAIEVFRRVLEDPPVPPCRIVPGIPRDLETIALKCLEKRPEQRYPSARVLAEDLDRYLKRLPLQARRPGPVSRLWLWARAHPWGVTGMASVFQLAMIGLAYKLWQQTLFLKWQIANPGHAIPFDVFLVHSAAPASLLIFGCMLVGYLPLKDLRTRLATGRAFERVDVWKFCLTGAVFAVIGVWLLLAWIRGYVWQHEHSWRWPWLGLLPSLSFFWFGSIIGLKAVRGYHAGRHTADVLSAQLGSPIRTSPTRFLLLLFAALGLLTPAGWLVLGSERGAPFVYLVTNLFLLLLGLAFWRKARDEMRPFWQFLIVAMAGLSVELGFALTPLLILAAVAVACLCAFIVVRRVGRG